MAWLAELRIVSGSGPDLAIAAGSIVMEFNPWLWSACHELIPASLALTSTQALANRFELLPVFRAVCDWVSNLASSAVGVIEMP